NFERRVEVMFPLEDPALIQRICKEIVPIYLNDNSRARVLQQDGSYERVQAWNGEPEHRSQYDLLSTASIQPSASTSKLSESSNGKSAKSNRVNSLSVDD
ncbi:MAG: hypothetical protein AAGD11_15265, partial [Planctomycetota bacterium]